MLRAACLAFALFGVVGCFRELPPEPEGTTPDLFLPTQSVNVDLRPETPNVDLADLLKASRADLALRCEEVERTISDKEGMRQEGRLVYTLLPNTRFPLATPLFRYAKYAARKGMSHPPYMTEAARDSAVAYQLARHGDFEAAAAYLHPSDKSFERDIRSFRFEMNYPLEWTRFVSLAIHAAEIDVASDHFDAAKQLMTLHRQLRKAIGEKHAKTALAATLYGRGLDTLKAAADAWRAGEFKDRAEQVDAFFVEVGAAPQASAITVPRDGDVLARFFGASTRGGAVLAPTPVRVLDVLNLPLPHDGLDTCVAFLGDQKRIGEIAFTYRPLLGQVDLQTPTKFGHHFDAVRSGRAETAPGHVSRHIWDIPNGLLEVLLTPTHPTLGGVARLRFGRIECAGLPRDFGAVSLDRGFDAARRQIGALGQRGDAARAHPKAVPQILNPLPTRTPTSVWIDRDPGVDAVQRVRYEFADDLKDTSPALGKIAQPLLLTLGQPEFVVGEPGGDVDLVWQDARTKIVISFPYMKTKQMRVTAADASGLDAAARTKAIEARERAERKARIDTNRPYVVAPRILEGFKLGMTRATFVATAPKSANHIQRDIPGGVMIAYLGPPQAGAETVAREWFGRFDGRGTLVEVRVRYADAAIGGLAKKFATLKAALGEAEPTEVMVWDDLPKGAKALRHQWTDDLTRVAVLHDPYSMEISLRHCPLEHPGGTPLPVVEYLPKGTSECSVGMSKEKLMALAPQAKESGFLVTPPTDEPFDAILVWVEGDRVVRVLARHKSPPIKADADAAKTLVGSWGKSAASLGWPLRQDVAGPSIQSLASRDDATRFRMFWRQEEGAVSLFSEWQAQR